MTMRWHWWKVALFVFLTLWLKSDAQTCNSTTNGALRLVGGTAITEGRVEICNSNVWGTVCDDFWSTNDAVVVCRQLGFVSTGAVALSRASFGAGSGQIWLDNVVCTGNERRLIDCTANALGSHNCVHSEDAGVRCTASTTCVTGAVRLVGSSNANEGRVEICNNNVWGTVCDDSWSPFDAIVTCRQLGFLTTGATALARAPFGQGTGQIWLDNVACRSTESRLIECPANNIGTHNCAHSEDAGVRCTAPTSCTQGAIRLINGATEGTGRVEVCNNNAWGTVCDDAWGANDANVACGQLGYSNTGATAVSFAAFGAGTGSIWLDNVGCVGTESRLIDCPANAIGSHNCRHSEDAGVRCVIGCTQGAIRLVGGTNEREGRVEICNNNVWGTVCDDSWSTFDAIVVCRQLGFSTTGATALSRATFGQGTGQIWLDDVRCTSTETMLIDCPASPLGTHNCAHSEDAGVRCQALPTCTNGDIRLVGGSSQLEGRVEVCVNGAWGTVCDDFWGTVDAQVVCRQLGFSVAGAIARSNAFFGQGTVPILLDNVACVGTESTLLSCTYSSTHNCVHAEDAGVTCLAATHNNVNCTTGDLRLVGGSNPLEGRVEICYYNQWGTVCDDSWSPFDARVVCGQLGYSSTIATAFASARFGAGSGPIVMDDVRCTATENRLIDCPATFNHNCVHSEDAGVRCTLSTTGCTTGDLRLAGTSTSSLQGRVELCNNNQWGTVCDDLWGTPDATVVCRQLGYSRTGATSRCCAGFGQGTGSIFLDNVQCDGTENRLLDCTSNPIGIHNCAHSEDAGVTCTTTCADGDIRLSAGRNGSEGRLEICSSGSWGTVCDDFFGNVDAQVACNQLGFSSSGAVAYFTTSVPDGTGSILLDNVQCTGTESRIIDCPHNGVGTHNCAHSEDVGVRCQIPGCAQGDIRLVGGATSSEGRVEFCNGGVWGTVCDDLWTTPDAQVVCRQLGLTTTGAVALSRATFGQGTGSIWLDNVNCAGTEGRLADCPANPIGSHNCVHSEDAGVRCGGVTCTQGDVRLVGGSTALEGRVEICNNNAWGTVCDDFWSTNDANVVCRQLGYSGTGATARCCAAFGQGTGSIILDNVLCTGSELTLLSCPANPIGSHNCVHSEDAGVVCQPATTTCTTGDIRLVNGANATEGRVEVCNNNAWGTVCDDAWGPVDASVACRQAGFSATGAVAVSFAGFGQGTGPILLDNVACTGNEPRLWDCPNNGVGVHNCGHSEDAGVRCQPTTTTCTQGAIRLRDGANNLEGRVEICNNNNWGTVCDDFWSTSDANVACRQLGFRDTGATTLTGSAVVDGTGQIVLDNLFCAGTESRLVDCPSNGLGNHNCVHSEDAGVRCLPPVSTCTNGDIRLIGGSNSYEGRVEVCNNNAWGTVCDDSWGTPDATVTCRQLGYSTTGAIARSRAFFGQGTGSILLDDVACIGTETRLVNCQNRGIGVHNCAHSEDAGVTCQPPTTACTTQGDIRLVGGTSELEGRVEFCNSNQWGTVCDDLWGTPDATVVCRQLGFSTTGAVAVSFAQFGQGTGSIWLDNVNCAGTEARLASCPANPIGSHNCIHAEDAGVRCQPSATTAPPPCANGDIRLVGGSNDFEGRVEICNNRVWGTVCDDLWGTTDANVACGQLGYSSTGATAFSFARFGQGTGPILLDNVGCLGTERRLVDCPNNGIGVHNCNHFEDAGVRCLQGTTAAPVCTQGDIRLVGGTTEYEGRVEVCNSNAWGTVCDDFWSTTDANVACRQLGLSGSGATARCCAFYGQGTGQIVLDNLFCVGTETSLFSCPHNGIGSHNCAHSEDAGVTCVFVCNNGDIRLVGGTNDREGRVEVCDSQDWGTVCDDFWSSVDAGVACVQLGYQRTGASAFSNAFFGQGTGRILLDNLGCIGTENRLVDCPHNGIGIENCVHAEDAGLRCTGQCVTGDVRLVGGSGDNEGRVEVCSQGVWGTVCDDLWGTTDANVVCGQLGYSNQGAIARSRAFFGQGSGQILLDNVACTGTETRLIDCPNNGVGIHNCVHAEDAGVTCQIVTTPPPCSDWDLRLVGGSSDTEGRLEVCFNATWGTVCDDFWDNTDAGVVCYQLGYARQGAIGRSRAFFGQGTGPIQIDNVQCSGTENRLQDCNLLRTHNCAHFEDAGVTCLVCDTGALRLVGGSVPNEGRVEVCNNQQWGTVCDDFWGQPDANVACRQAGFSRFNAQARSFAAFGQGTGPILLDNLGCTGNEARLFDCPNNGIGNHNCLHSEDAGVVCRRDLVCNHGSVRLRGGPTTNVGRVEICANETWGTVCDDFWGSADAGVICRQLGFSRFNATALSNAFYGQGSGPIHIDDVACTGTETNILLCRYDSVTSDCGHSEDAGVQCQVDKLCDDGDIRLVGRPSSTMYEGRVELCYGEEWGTVCDDSWNDPDATVVCRQLGYSDTGAQAVSFAAYGQGTGPILLDDVACTGTETRLIECRASPITTHNCVHFEDASVRCQAPPRNCTSGEVRLVGGSSESEGRVEFCQSGTWGTVCDDAWGVDDATVVCRQLGYADVNSVAYSLARFGQGSGPIYLDQVGCTGSEAMLGDCSANPIGVHDCSHFEDAGVGCQVCVNGDIRLVDGSTQYEGRVEVCVNSAWGTVCDDFWDNTDASVVCRQAGFSDQNATARSFAFFGQGTDPIVLDDVRCTGNESRLIDCPYNPTHNCIHFEDAGVICQPMICSTGDIRLQGGSNDQEGRVEICMNGIWGTVCDDSFNFTDASVACRQLGFSRFHAVVQGSAFYGAGSGPIYLDDVQCIGNESSLLSCSYTSQHNCVHGEDVGVQCRAELICNDTDIRLVGGSDQYEGRVEICFNETWGTICDGSWSTNDANVACRQLGYGATGATAFTNAFFGEGTGPIYLDDFLCRNTENRLVDCPNGGLNMIDFCNGHADDAGVRCPANCTEGDLRLVNGQTDSEGRVEVCRNRVWGTVCDDFWGTPDAQVVCRQLGYTSTGARAFSFAFFGQGTGPIQIDDVQCRGTESRLLDCTHRTTHNCIHFEDAGVRCQGCRTGDIRLIGGSSPNEGRVEVCQANVWGTVCDDFWGTPDATVVCRQLGFSSIGAIARTRAFFGAGTGNIFLDDVQCTGTEAALSDCQASTMHNCVHSEDAGVTCVAAPMCNTGQVRLVGGTDRFEGRIEVCINETWGTVCDDAWDAMDANVVCGQLGYSRYNATAYPGGRFSSGAGPIFIDNSACSGNENRLFDCPYDMHTADCTHAEDAGLRCSGRLICEYGDLRLVGGANDLEGRVEICINETWGTVCDGGWSTFDAIVACRQLGYRPAGAVPLYNAAFGPGTGRIWIDDILCNSRESRLIDCPNGGIGMIDFCNGHNDDAGLRCMEGCVNGQVRLVGGTAPTEGRVEVCQDQTWGTVCDDLWGPSDASVVCRQLGYSRINATALSNAPFGPGTGPIFLDNVACTGEEDMLTSCAYDSNTADCFHSDDAGVTCVADLVCANGELRLAGSTTAGQGRVEICINETWGTICDDSWGTPDASVACQALGFSRFGAQAVSAAFFGQGTGPILLDDLGCFGNESSLLDCSAVTQHNCAHSEDAGVRCVVRRDCSDGDIRLVNSPAGRNYSGRVEVCRNEQWGTVCDDAWDNTDASVACRQLGFSRYNSVARTNAFYGQGSGPINIDDPGCTGSEQRLIDCPFSPIHNCAHSEDAGVDCIATKLCEEGAVRLQGGTTNMEGRVEICINETWSTICDNSWSINDANVVCQQLGYLEIGSVAYSNARFGQGTGPIALNNLACTGSEASVLDCPSDGLFNVGTCTHGDDVGVECQEECETGDIRLRGGTTQYEGRVEICIDRVWGTVCDDFWGTVDAAVACRQLGYSEHNVSARLFAAFGQGTGPIHLDDLFCNGNEDALINCTYDSNTADCSHFEDAGVVCQPCSNGEIRLEGGSTLYEGRVEICRNQQWGTVCDNMWTNVDATVVCRHLGYSGFNAQAFSNAFYGQGRGSIYLDNVQCSGSELDLFDCPGDNTPSCTQADAAGVRCNPTPVCEENAVRLVGGLDRNAGRVEVCVLETWRTVCDRSWTSEDASVVCRQLGFSRWNAVAQAGGTYPQGSGPIWATNVVCTSEEGRLVDCGVNTDTTTCTHANDAGVTCNITVLCNNGDLRLRGGNTELEGRVELCWNETWGTICDGFWSTFDANVACRQLGFSPTGAVARPNAFFGQGTGPIWLDDLLCRGNEQRLVDCPVSTGGIGMIDFCNGHADDAGVTCQMPCESGSVRLVGGTVPWEGRVEVCKDESWGTVCDDFWSTPDATVVCRWAGFSPINSTALSRAAFGLGTGPIHFDDVRCTGSEGTLFDCPFNAIHNCNHFEDAGVRCLPDVCVEDSLRLVNGATDMEGRVEICVNDTWTSICSNLWTTNDGNVACKQLGYSQLNSVTYTDGRFGAGTGQFFLASLQCTGSEPRLVDCPRGSTAGCSHPTDAGVTCAPKVCDNGQLRLVGGSTEYEGRVEVCYNEAWGTICDDGFDNADATVICRQVGYSQIGAVARSNAAYGQGTGLVYLSALECIGNETSIVSCAGPGFFESSPCAHNRDAGVMCQRRQAFPSNIRVDTLSNTSINVRWSAPNEFYSTIIEYRVTCNSSRSSATQQTPTNETLNLIFNNLYPYTNYTCCVETRYTDETENDYACATNTTFEGIPGPPTNLVATPSLEQCQEVRFSWDLPPEDERNGVIRQYRIRVVGLDQSGFERTYTTSSTIELINDLDCCTSYEYSISAFTIEYGPPTPTRNIFKTQPDIVTNPVQGSITVEDAQTMSISWITPQEIINQGLGGFQLAITAECFTGAQPTATQTFNIRPDEPPSQRVVDLQPFIPYAVRLVATICDLTIPVFNRTVYTQEETRISAPTITSAERISNDMAVVTFDPQDEVTADLFIVDYYLATDLETSNLSEANRVGTIQSIDESNRVSVRNLDACTGYWATITAINCGARITSTAQLIGLKDPQQYELVASLASSVGPCDTWVNTNTARKINDVENGLRLPLVLCGYSIPCYGYSQWSCSPDDPTKATFTTWLVGDEQTSSTELKTCINDWFQSSSGARNFTVDGNSNFQVFSPGSAEPSEQTPSGISVPGWAWAIVAIGGVGFIVTILLIVVIILTRRRKTPVQKQFQHEQMLDDMEQSRSQHSIGIVENPLYAEDEAGPTYAGLAAKEKESEAEMEIAPEKGQAFSVNFGPPSADDDF